MPSTAELAAVFADTMHWIQTHPALSAAAADSAARTVHYRAEDAVTLPENPQYAPSAAVSPDRSFEAAVRLREQYPDARIAVLNFASATHPGGGVIRGARAQEECLCRCSTLYPALDTPELAEHYYHFHQQRHDARYTDAVIYTPDVLIVKSDTDLPARLPESAWCRTDIITCAAPNRSAAVISDTELTAIHQRRFRRILTTAAAHHAEVLVLGAFGCGAFRNPPELVAAVCKELLPEFAGYFRHIEFAVYCPPKHPENYEAFRRMLCP